jgi:hypothetical protein
MAAGDVVPDSEIWGDKPSAPPASTPDTATPGSVVPDEVAHPTGKIDPADDVGYGAAIEAGLVGGAPGGRAAAAAAETYLPRALSGAPAEATSDYQQNYARIGKQMETARKQYPKTTFASAAAPQVFAAAVAPEAAGGSMLRTVGSNALWGGATTANEGDQPFDPYDYASKFGWGSLTGGSAAMMTSGLGSLLLPYGAAGRDAVLAAAKRQGVDIPKYIGSISPVLQRFGQLGRNLPGLGEKVADATSKMTEEMADAATAASVGKTPYTAGKSAKAAIENWVGPTTDAINDANYTNASSMMNNTIKTPISNAAAQLQKLAQFRGTYNDPLTGTAIDKINQALKMPGGLTYEGIKNLRTAIGGMGNFGSLLPNELKESEISNLYGALSKDLDAAAGNAGGPAAQQAHQFANDSYKKIADQREAMTTLLGGDPNAENVFSTLKARASGRPASGDIDTLRLAKQTILASNNPGAWDDLGKGMISTLGRKGQGTGDFSPAQFLTDVKGLSPDAKDEIFGRSGTGSAIRDSLDDLGTMSERYQQAARFGNPSGTGHVIAGAAIAEQVIHHLSTILSHPVTTGGAIVGGLAGGSALGNYLSKPATAGALTNFMKQHASWMAQPTVENMNRLRFAASRLSASAASQFGVTVGPAALVSSVASLQREWGQKHE